MPDEILYVQSRRLIRVKRAQTVQHVVAAVVLMSGGVDHLHHNTALAVAEIAAGALLIGAVAVEKLHHHHNARIAWVEFAGAVMTLVEAVERTQGRHHKLFYVVAYLAPALLFTFALFDAQINALRYIKVGDDGVEVRLGLFFRKKYAWDEITSGTRTIELKGITDPDHAREWLAAAFRARGIETLPA